MAQAQAEMNVVSADLGKQYPEIREWGVHLVTLLDTFVSPELKTGLLMLLWAVGFVLLIACANVAICWPGRRRAEVKWRCGPPWEPSPAP